MTIDVQSAVLVYLKRNPDGASTRAIAEAIGRSATAVRNNLKVIEHRGPYGGNPWVKSASTPGTRERIWTLTPDGQRVAGYRTATAKRNR